MKFATTRTQGTIVFGKPVRISLVKLGRIVHVIPSGTGQGRGERRNQDSLAL